jgi:23S rRNA pseudouridine2605 synthase
MADAGVAARRMCEEMIETGRVSVNGEVTRKLPVFVDPENDTILVEGRPLQRPERKLYLMVNKPQRMLVTNADEPEFDRATIMEIVDHPAKARLFPVGRLDFESAGLVIMTNDGELANALTHPKYNVPKVYEALIKGHIDQSLLDGVRIKIRGLRKRSAREDGTEGPVSSGPVPEFEFIRHQGDNSIVHISLLEAKNRELRDVLSFLGMPIKKLTRIGLGGLTLTGVAPASWRELTREEIHLLRRPRGGFVAKPRVVQYPAAATPGTPGARPGAPAAAQSGARPRRPFTPAADPRDRHSAPKLPGAQTRRGANPNNPDEERSTRRPARRINGRTVRPQAGEAEGSMSPRPARRYDDRRPPSGRPFASQDEAPESGRTARPSRPPMNDFSVRPARPGRPKAGGRPEQGGRPERGGKPSGSSRSSGSARPSGTARPTGSRPSDSRLSGGRPSGGRTSGSRPSGDKRSSGGERPSGGGDRGGKPGGRPSGRPEGRSGGRPDGRSGGKPGASRPGGGPRRPDRPAR